MTDEILSYIEVCLREGVNLQKGMYFDIGNGHSVLLMSLRRNAPYKDRFEGDDTTLIYEGHDAPHRRDGADAKTIDQPEYTSSGRLTENGKFHKAAQEYKKRLRAPARVRIYEKLRMGIWSYAGLFHLVDSWMENDGQRNVFKFKLVVVEDDSMPMSLRTPSEERQRFIPTAIKLAVWKRDGGKCVICGAIDELHFDHIIPYSKGGTSLKAENVQLLCARHNLAKHNRIE